MNRLDNFQCCLARKLGLGIFELGTSSLLNKFHCKETFHYLILKKTQHFALIPSSLYTSTAPGWRNKWHGIEWWRWEEVALSIMTGDTRLFHREADCRGKHCRTEHSPGLGTVGLQPTVSY